MDRPKTEDLAVEDAFQEIDKLCCKYMNKGMEMHEALTACFRAIEILAEDTYIPIHLITEGDE